MTAAHRLRRLIAAPFSRRPFLLQRLRWPNPLSPPYRQKEIVLYRPGELGDVVMCLAVVRAIRERNPHAHLTLVTHFHELLAGHPLLNRVLSPDAADQATLRRMISLRYEVFIPLRWHVIDYFAGCVGLTDIAHDIPLPDFGAELGELGAHLQDRRPRIAVCRTAGPFTPNKDWPAERWDELIRRLEQFATVIELGATAPAAGGSRGPLDWRGRTTVRQYCAVIARVDLVITPVSSAVHIAAAYRVPTLSILGGYELPLNTAYPRHVALARSPSCSPCWRREPCPFDRACLREIGVDEVEAAARHLLRGSR
ncbi:MAG: glycosyltransferase family 9 protein [Verrucomicrobia bacterium]|nr:glycosyltransferase family 9 protein [Verrucomicrobiota bacterium]